MALGQYILPEATLIAYSQAVAATFPHEQDLYSAYFRIAGYTVQVSATSQLLLTLLTRALAHLQQPETKNPDLKIYCWDGDPLPPSPINWYAAYDRTRPISKPLTDGRFLGPMFNSSRIMTSVQMRPGILQLLDTQGDVGFFWIDRVANLPNHSLAEPFHAILIAWMSEHGIFGVHTAAMGLPEDGIIFIGDKGCGKSTSALACLQSPLRYAGDDYCLVAIDPEPRVYSLYSSAKLVGKSDLQRFPYLEPFVSNKQRNEGVKALLFIQEFLPEKPISCFPLRALIIPRVTGASTACAIRMPVSTSMWRVNGALSS